MEKNQLQVFRNELFEVAVKLENEEIVFDVEKVGKCLGFTQIKNGREYIRWETINRYLRKSLSQDVGKGDLIPESAVYKLAFKASNEVAERFQDWLAVEVIPSVRKHGAYMTDEMIEEVLLNPDTIIKLATQLKEEKQARKLAEEKVKVQNELIDDLQPQAIIGDKFTNDDGLYDMARFCKIVDLKGMGRNNMFAYLRSKNILRYNNEPYQRYMEHFKVIMTESKYNGDKIPKTLIKSKGIKFIVKSLINDGYLVTKSANEILDELERN